MGGLFDLIQQRPYQKKIILEYLNEKQKGVFIFSKIENIIVIIKVCNDKKREGRGNYWGSFLHSF